LRLKGKVALITGSSRGIGKSIALAFAKEGANVVVNFVRSQEKAREVASEIEKIGGKAIAIKADVSNSEEVENMVKRAIEEFDRIDILVNNAADKSVMGLSLDTPDWKSWDKMVAVNVKGMLICSQVVSRYMLEKKGGNIINIVADWPGGGLSYMLTKSAGIPLTKGLARALAPHIRVNAICPGSIDTGWISALPEEEKIRLKEKVLLKRWGKPDDVAKVAVFLASDDAGFLTGTIILVDGGEYINPL